MKLLGNLAIEKGWMTMEQLQLVISDQKISYAQIGEILVNKKILKQNQLDELLDIHEARVFYIDEILFGKIAVHNNFIDQKIIDSALSKQKKINESEKIKKTIGEILLEAGQLTQQQCDAILKAQNRLAQKKEGQENVIVKCPKCSESYPVQDPDRNRKLRCGACRFVFEIRPLEVSLLSEKNIPTILSDSSKSDTQSDQLSASENETIESSRSSTWNQSKEPTIASGSEKTLDPPPTIYGDKIIHSSEHLAKTTSDEDVAIDSIKSDDSEQSSEPTIDSSTWKTTSNDNETLDSLNSSNRDHYELSTKGYDSDVTQDSPSEPKIRAAKFNINHGVSLYDFLKKEKIVPNADLSGSTSEILASSYSARYYVGDEIARGGMGAILKTRDLNIRRNIVTKVLLNKRSSSSVVRFLEEGQITGQLQHPNIPPIYDLGINEEDKIFFTMKLIKGDTLHRILYGLKEKDPEYVQKYPVTALIDIIIKVCDALSYSHSKRVIHRDIKPDNIMVGEFGEVLLMDWGLAKILGRKEEEIEDLVDPVSSVRSISETLQTIQGTAAGTPSFMAPEQAQGKIDHLDQTTDVYGIGAVLYCCLAFHPPVEGENVQIKLLKTAQGKTTPLAENIPSELRAIVQKAIALKQENRFQSISEFAKDLFNYQKGFSVSAKTDSLLELFSKLIKRNKALSSGILIAVMALITGFAMTAWQFAELKKEQVARNEDNRISAPKVLAVAQRAILNKDFEAALLNANIAIDYDPELSAAYLLKAQLLIHSRKFQKAISPLKSRLKIKEDNNTEKLLELCQKTLASKLSPEFSVSFAEIFEIQNMHLIAISFTVSSKKQFQIYKKRIEVNFPGSTFSKYQNGKLTLNFNLRSTHNVDDLSALRGIPLNEITFMNCKNLRDLSPLDSLPLYKLNFSICPALKDISPLKNLKLKWLDLTGTKVVDISPLKGMLLENLHINSSPVSDITPLKGMPLKSLTLYGTKITTLEAIKGMPLEFLQVTGPSDNVTPIDLSPLKGMLLKTLVLYGFHPRDISVLKGMPLTQVELTGSFRDLTPLKGMKLWRVRISYSLVTDISILKGMPIRYLILSKNKIKNISPLKGMMLTSLELNDTLITDISPLAGMPLIRLDIGHCNMLKKLKPLSTLIKLEDLCLPEHMRKSDLSFLKKLPSLKKIGFGQIHETQKVSIFWKNRNKPAEP
ncbi:MAG: hypothetical protein COA79_12605 [Planctomycetota bacterium]|nr:MAG: hypothetical protein COA79_12605 [Planctomycetota bacterium]